MSKIPLWKWVVAIAPLVGSIVILFLPQESSATGLAGLNVKLGLDLRGGIHMVMQVRTDDAIRTEVDAAEARLRHALSESGAAFERIERPTVTELQVLGVADAARESVQKVLTEQLPQWSITPGAGGLRATMGSVQEANLRDQADRGGEHHAPGDRGLRPHPRAAPGGRRSSAGQELDHRAGIPRVEDAGQPPGADAGELRRRAQP
jgi:preprotein translocase subunit SecD